LETLITLSETLITHSSLLENPEFHVLIEFKLSCQATLGRKRDLAN